MMKALNCIPVALALVCLMSCTAEKMESPSAKGHVISLTSQVQTRATADPQTTALNTANAVGVFVTSSSETLYDNISHSVESTGDLTASSTMNYPSEDNATVNIYAYAPYVEGTALSSDNAFTLSADQSTDAGYLASDLVYASVADQAASENTVALSFAHKLSQLQVTVNNQAALDLSTAAVYITGTKIGTTFNPSTGAVGEATGNATDIKAVAALGTATTAYGIVVPQTIESGTGLVKIIAGEKTYIAKLSSGVTLEAGKAYSFTVKLTSSTEPVVEVAVSLGSTSITEWGAPTSLGEATMEEEVIEVEPLYATFGTPGGNASYDATTSTYTWTGSTNNLMNCFSFENGELASYTTLHFTFSELSEGGSVRINVLYSDNTNKSKTYYNAGTKVTALSELLDDTHTLADVTAIRFGGNSNSGSAVIKATEMYLDDE